MVATTFTIGDGTDSTNVVTFDLGLGAANPKIRFNATTDVWEMAADGSTYGVVSGSGGSTTEATNLFNNTGGQITEGDLCYIPAYNSGAGLYEAAKAIVTGVVGTTLYAWWIANETIADQGSGQFVKTKTLTGLDTSGGTVGRPVYLDTTAGGWTLSLPAMGNLIQIVGQIIEVHATTGRIQLHPQAPILSNYADQV